MASRAAFSITTTAISTRRATGTAAAGRPAAPAARLQEAAGALGHLVVVLGRHTAPLARALPRRPRLRVVACPGRPVAGRRVSSVLIGSLRRRRLGRQQLAVLGHRGQQLGVGADVGDGAAGEHGDPVGQQHGRRPVRHDDAGDPRAAPASAPPRPTPRCGCRGPTACRRAPAPRAGPAPPGPGPGAVADRRTGSSPAHRSGCPGPRAGRRRTGPGPPRSPRRSRPSLASGRPRVRFSRADMENNVGSSNAVATTVRSWLQPQVADVHAVDGDRPGGHVVQPRRSAG